MPEPTNQSKNFILAIPYIALVIGLACFCIGTFLTFENVAWKEFWSGFGKTLLASGIFALLLKTIQFMGVFKEELSKVVYDTKFLENRKDLAEVWEGVSKVMFKNKFPKISKAITHDIRNLYFPTEHVLYYDDYKQTIEIELFDPLREIVKVKQYSQYTVYPKDRNTKFTHATKNSIKFDKIQKEVSFAITKYTINDKDVKPVITEEVVKNCLNTKYCVELSGEDAYKFETIVEKQYSLLNDNVIGTVKDFLIHDFDVKILLKGSIDIDFYSAGTLNNFKQVGAVNQHFREFEYNGILYPRQGYLFVIRKTLP